MMPKPGMPRLFAFRLGLKLTHVGSGVVCVRGFFGGFKLQETVVSSLPFVIFLCQWWMISRPNRVELGFVRCHGGHG